MSITAGTHAPGRPGTGAWLAIGVAALTAAVLYIGLLVWSYGAVFGASVASTQPITDDQRMRLLGSAVLTAAGIAIGLLVISARVLAGSQQAGLATATFAFGYTLAVPTFLTIELADIAYAATTQASPQAIALILLNLAGGVLAAVAAIVALAWRHRRADTSRP